MSVFLKYLLLTAIPLVALSLGGMLLHNALPLLVVLLASLACAVAGVVLVAKDRTAEAAGVLTGMAIGVVSLGASCFAMPWMT
jgi:hypothetical protein